MATILRDEFVNKSGGFIGVTTINARGDRTSLAVAPGDSVWLSEEEQIETANAPRSDADNPLVNGQLELRTRGEEIKNRRPLRPDPDAPVTPASADPEPEPEVVQETGATPEAAGEPEEGDFAEHEEVATPEAATADKPARRRKAAA